MAHTSALQSATEAQFHLSKLIKDAKGKNMEGEMLLAKEQFSKDKFNYLELETKQAFLLFLEGRKGEKAGLDMLESQLSPESMKLIDEGVATSKEAVNKQKKVTQKNQAELAKTIVEVAELYRQFEESRDLLKKKIAVAKGETIQEPQVEEAPADEEMKDAEEAKLTPVEQKARDMNTWYSNATTLLQSISAVEYNAFHDDTLSVTLLNTLPAANSVPNSRIPDKFELRVTFDADAAFHTVKMVPDYINVGDIVAYATETQDLAFLAGEIKGRVHNYRMREICLRKLQNRYTIDWSLDNPMIRMAFPNGTTASINLNHDFPLPHSRPFVSRISGNREVDYQSVADELNRSTLSLEDMLSRIESL